VVTHPLPMPAFREVLIGGGTVREEDYKQERVCLPLPLQELSDLIQRRRIVAEGAYACMRSFLPGH
jgi:hypothetical protein